MRGKCAYWPIIDGDSNYSVEFSAAESHAKNDGQLHYATTHCLGYIDYFIIFHSTELPTLTITLVYGSNVNGIREKLVYCKPLSSTVNIWVLGQSRSLRPGACT